MKDEWRKYADKFLTITPREQYLVLATGFIFVTFIFYSLFIEASFVELDKSQKAVTQLSLSNASNEDSINLYNEVLTHDPNVKVNKDIAHYEKKLAATDKELLTLTSDLIDPVQMRFALLELLDLQKGVSLVSFELVGVKEISFNAQKPAPASNEKNDKKDINTDNEKVLVSVQSSDSEGFNLYQHGIRVKLKGSYFQLRDYLQQLENLSWKFFWQDFQYDLQTYPESEVEIEMYSLSTKREFIGV